MTHRTGPQELIAQEIDLFKVCFFFHPPFLQGPLWYGDKILGLFEKAVLSFKKLRSRKRGQEERRGDRQMWDLAGCARDGAAAVGRGEQLLV